MKITLLKYSTTHISQPRRALLLVPLLLCCLLTTLAACAPHSGGDTIAFLRDGQLWTIQPDGSEAIKVAGDAVASFAWSPDHHQIIYRYGPLAYSVAKAIPPLSTAGAPDAPGDLAIVSINGGFSLQISPSSASVPRGDAWWDANGNRVLYSEGISDTAPTGYYIESQVDQPVGIARKPLLDAASIPVLSADGSQVAVIDPAGNVRVGKPAAIGAVVATGALLTLPKTGRPVRLLWQPHHNALLYEAASASGVTLLLHTLGGATRTIGMIPALLDLAFSPDGSRLLLRTPQGFTLWNVGGQNAASFTWSEADPLALPSWSSDGRQLLIQDAAGLQLINVVHHMVRPLLTYANAQPAQLPPPPTWHPAAGSPWSADGSQIVFVATRGSQWQGTPLPAPSGSNTDLYIATHQGQSFGAPMLLSSGNIRAPSWSYLDPSTAFLVTA